jgi:putative ABC transport system substrate-binding protein
MLKTLTTAAAAVALLAGAASAQSIGVAWMGKSGSVVDASAGLEKRLSEIAPEIEIEYRRDLADEAALSKAVKELSSRHDALGVWRSNGSKWLSQNQTTLPTFIAAGNHPPSLGSVRNMDAPEGNVTGVSIYLDPVVALETFAAIAPAMTRVAVITQLGHPGSAIDAEGLKQACDALFLECGFHQVEDSAGLAELAGAVDADSFVIGNQASLANDKAEVAKFIEAAGDRPVFTLYRKLVDDGALAAMAVSNYKLGYMLGDKIVAVLKQDAAIKDVPVSLDPEPTLILNMETLQRLGLDVPRQMLEAAEQVGS